MKYLANSWVSTSAPIAAHRHIRWTPLVSSEDAAPVAAVPKFLLHLIPARQSHTESFVAGITWPSTVPIGTTGTALMGASGKTPT